MKNREKHDEEDESSPVAGTRGLKSALPLVVAVVLIGVVILSIFAGLLPPFMGMAAVALALATFFWRIRDRLPGTLLVFVAVFLVSVVATKKPPKWRPDRIAANEGDELSAQWKATGKFNEKLPIVMHLIFDEMMSPGAMTDDLPGGAEMRQSFREFGEKHALRMFDSVYSRYFFSGISMPTMMNPEYRGKTDIRDVLTPQLGDLRENAYFDDMAARGYRTVVFQTALMNFCANRNVDLCETFDSFDPGGKGDVGLDERNQRAILWQTIVRAYQPSYLSEAGQAMLHRVYGLKTSEVGVLGTADRYDAQRFPAWFDRFRRFATGIPRGTHLFAHFMVPHSPYLLSEDCVGSGRFEGGYYLAKYEPAEQVERRRRYYDGYFAQLRCVQHKLDDLLDAIHGLDNYRDAVIIIHGDHGSRISSGNVLEDYSERDYVDNYAAFFAVQSPAAPAGVDCEFVSLPEVFRRYVAPAQPPRPPGPPLPVIVRSRVANGRVEASMPVFGCAAQGLSQ